MKVTNTKNYSHSIGYADPEKGKLNYTFNPGEAREDIPDEHEYLFTDIDGFEIGEKKQPTDTKEDSKTEKEVIEETGTNKKEEGNKESSKATKESKTFICPDCGVEFGRENVMLEHKETHKKEVKKEDK